MIDGGGEPALSSLLVMTIERSGLLFMVLAMGCGRPVATRDTSNAVQLASASVTDASTNNNASADASASSIVDAAAVSATLPLFAGPIAADDGIVFAPTPGGAVTLRVIGEGQSTLTLRDGERVRFIEEDSGIGEGSATATVSARGVRGEIPNASLIRENRVHRSGDGRWVFFGAISSCGDFCHSDLWLFGADGTRLKMCADDAPACGGHEHNVVWSPDGRTLVVSSAGLYIADLRSQPRVRAVSMVASPVFSSSGRLFARQIVEGDAVVEVRSEGDPRVVLRVAGFRQSAEEGPAPEPPVFESDGAALCAAFSRGNGVRFARATLDGAAVRGTRPCAR
ncbi:MAG: hypothetical protein U0269_25100 [Polyangiales bacterium]